MNEMQVKAAEGVLMVIAGRLNQPRVVNYDGVGKVVDDLRQAVDMLDRICPREASSPAESAPCGPVVDAEKAREGLRALRAVIGQLSSQDHERWRREATDVIVDLIAVPGSLGEAIASEVRFALRAF